MKNRTVRVVCLCAVLCAALLLSGCRLTGSITKYLSSLRPAAKEQPTEVGLADGPVLMDAYEGLAVEAGYSPQMDVWYGGYYNTEEYAALAENGFRLVSTSPLSTFSADVDTASYCNLRRMLNEDRAPSSIPAGAVRLEEMINYFRYDYPAPMEGKFSVTAQIAPCPWNGDNMLLMLGLRAAEAPKAAENGSNLVFLMDVSGSMKSEAKLPLAKEAMILLLDSLTEKDTVSIVTYASGEEIRIEGANPARDREALEEAISSLEAGGSTYGEKGLTQAYDVAQRYFRPGGNNRVILCSDGDLNVGITSESELHDFVTRKKETGVYLSVLGFGEGNYKDTKMETLADDGNGSYYYIDSILEARKVLCEEMTSTLFTVADDVKFQIEFNPAYVASYRQIGYENRALENEDFENDKRDAGEVGAGACVTVLYELTPAGEGGESGLRYQTSQLTEEGEKSGEWLTLSIRYKEPGEAESQLETVAVTEEDVTDAPSADFRFAAAVAQFGMVLERSEHMGSASYAGIIDQLKDGGEGGTLLTDEYREELFSLVKIAQRLDALDR